MNTFSTIGDVWVEDGMIQAEFNPHYLPGALVLLVLLAFAMGRLTKRGAK